MRIALLLLTALLLLCGEAPAAAEESVLTQRDWMVNLVDGLGWSFGLPDEPEDADYEKILEGDRRLRIEAEQHKQPTDVVSVKRYQTFGPFSGEGWVSGVATPTTAHLRFLLPWGGSYRLSAVLRLAGHEITLGENNFRVDGENGFSEVPLGEVELAAGAQEIVVHIPPNGGIDYIELAAPPLPAIQPLEGWEPGRPLVRDDLAVTAVQILGLESLLPPTQTSAMVEAESATELGGAAVTDIRHLGKPSGGSWVRAGTAPANLQLPFTPPAAGVYTLLLRGAATSAMTATLNDRRTLTGAFPPYLQTIPVGTAYLAAGANILSVELPPRGGLDSLTLAGRRSAGEDYRRLTGLPEAEGSPSLGEMNNLLSLLAAIGASR